MPNVLLIIGDSIAKAIDNNALSAARGRSETVINRAIGGTWIATVKANLATNTADAVATAAGGQISVFLHTCGNDFGNYELEFWEADVKYVVSQCKTLPNFHEFIYEEAYPAITFSDDPASITSRAQAIKAKHWNERIRSLAISEQFKIITDYWVLHADNSWGTADEDRLPVTYTSDGVHLNSTGIAAQVPLIANGPYQPTGGKKYVWGGAEYPLNQHDTWAVWALVNTASISGDANKGSLSLPAINDAGVQPQICIGKGFKSVSILPAIQSGSVSIYYRATNRRIYRNAASPSWTQYTAPIKTEKMFLEVKLISTATNTVINDCTVQWGAAFCTTPTTIYIGNRPTLDAWALYNKDTYIDAYNGPSAPHGYITTLKLSQPSSAPNVAAHPIIRPSFYMLPDKPIIDSAKLKIITTNVPGEAMSFTLRRLTTSSGPFLTWDEYDVDNNQQATFNAAKDHATAPVYWAGGGAFSAADYGSSVASVSIPKSTASGTIYEIDITAEVREAFALSTSFYGWVLLCGAGAGWVVNFGSQQNATEANRWYLEIVYRSLSGNSVNYKKVRTGISTGI